jgi:DNA modification methylase
MKVLQHNALYPLEVPMMCILSTTDKGDTILDPYNGLGTTGIIAYVNECKYLGIDISKVYAVKSSIRIEDFVKNYSKYKLNNKKEISFQIGQGEGDNEEVIRNNRINIQS